LFSNQARLALALWFKGEPGLKIDATLFDKCMAQNEQSRIDADVREASRLKIQATPTFVIGRRMGDGRIRLLSRINGNQAYDVFKNTLEAAATAELTSENRR
jgi:predicted DsbA family dithiol-disulfide isomerase